MKKTPAEINHDSMAMIVVVALITAVLIILMLIFGSKPAHAEVCYSREEARKKWPTQYLYWHYGTHRQRCWLDRRARSYRTPKPQYFVQEVDADEFNHIDAKAPSHARVLDPPQRDLGQDLLLLLPSAFDDRFLGVR